MKKITILISVLEILVAFVISSCDFSEDNESKLQKEERKILYILIYDITLSHDNYVFLNTNHVNNIYYNIGALGGGMFYGLHIKANSELQDPIEAQIPFLELLPEEGNAFQQENIKQLNDEKRSEFKQGEKKFLNDIKNNFLLPKTEEATDIENALILSRNILGNPEYKDWKKVLIIISDLLNEQQDIAGHEIKSPVQLPNDVIIALVRPSKEVNLKTIFNRNDFTVYSSIDDAINSTIK